MKPAAASAPGKIILFGEHAVVHGKPALAVPVSSLRATAEVFTSDLPGLNIVAQDTDDTIHLLDAQSADESNPLAYTVRLVLEHFARPTPQVSIRIHSQIPIASGLGSGAAVTTALARVMALAFGQPFDNQTLNAIVYAIEQIHHGTPSGIDNTVIVYEQPVYFVRHQPIETFGIGQPFRLLVADSGRRALTRDSVGDVGRLYAAEPGHIQPMFDRIGEIVEEARAKIMAGEVDNLGLLMNENHTLLQALTVSSPELDRLVEAALQAGALGAKLSGGGRGGNMIALVTETTSPAVEAALLQAGAAQVFSTIVG